MHIENAKKLIGQLERLRPEQFRMDVPIRRWKGCRTVGCIAGWCSLKNGGPKNIEVLFNDPDKDESNVWRFARLFLGLSPYEARALFLADWRGSKGVFRATLPEAIAELKRLVSVAEGASQ